MSKPKSHHFVPQMLLRWFAVPEDPERIWQLRVDDKSEPVRRAISKTAVVTHYYTHYRDRPRKEDDLFWEVILSELEGRAAESLRQLEADPEHIRGPAQALVLLQLLRTPLGQAQIAKQAEAERRRAFGAADDNVWMRWVLERTHRVPTLGEWIGLREAARAARAGVDHPLLEADATAILDEMMTVLTRSGFGERLRDGDWNLLHAEPDRFVIGDEPVTYSGQAEPARPIWAQSELPEQLTMPISPTRAIEVRRAPRPPGSLREKDIAEINLRAAGWATRFIYGPDPDYLARVRALWLSRGERTPPPIDAGRRRRR
jgi:uncharacterized protein DUF4238